MNPTVVVRFRGRVVLATTSNGITTSMIEKLQKGETVKRPNCWNCGSRVNDGAEKCAKCDKPQEAPVVTGQKPKNPAPLPGSKG
ncbi:MAG: hypothetical protein HY918_02460 [Candidatus Doudnabacteria bacterium]|nr:hypothetical protein [Candidatus Doudnabacteria bacterium]